MRTPSAVLATIVALAPALAAQEPRFGRLRAAVSSDSSRATHGATLAADVDGDGDLDVVQTYDGVLRRGDDLGRFPDPAEALPRGDIKEGFFADVDGDGAPDLLGGDDAVILLLNDGGGGFTDASASLPFLSAGQATDAADLDLDGDLDLLVGARLPTNATVFLNDGLGGFVDSPTSLPDTARALRGRLFDADADGDPDALLQTKLIGSRFPLYTNDGAASFARHSSPPIVGPPGNLLDVADFDADGDLDFVTGRPACCNGLADTRIYSNDGSGVFADQGVVVGLWVQGFAVGDLDGDGLPDLFTVDKTLGTTFFRNEGSFVFTPVPGALPSSRPPSKAHALDVDRDGDQDLFLASADFNRLWLNDGGGRFTDVTGASPESTEYTSLVRLGDLDGDGLTDAVLCVPETSILWNDGTGGFVEEQAPFLPSCSFVLPIDLDVDDDLDLLVVGRGLRLFDNLGGRRFEEVTERLPLAGFRGSPQPADVDGDGAPDLFLATTGQNYLGMNDGAGNIRNAVRRLPQRQDATVALLPGDLDGDGDVDGLVVNSGEEDRMLVNDGTGFFGEVSNVIPKELRYLSIAPLADMDLDGDLDFVGASTVLYYFANRGDGTFEDRTASWGFASIDGNIGLADLDGDGDVDGYSSENQLWLNVGGILSEASHLFPTRWFRGRNNFADAADLDGDGDVDVFLSGTPQVHFNLERQLAWLGTPRVGKPLALEIHGSADGEWILLTAPRRGLLGTDLGLLRIDPGGARMAAAGRLDANGEAVARFEVPPDPGLVGHAHFWQAIVGEPRRLTNLERTTFTDL